MQQTIEGLYMANKKSYRFPVWKVTFINAFDEAVQCTYVTEAQAIDNMCDRLWRGQAAWMTGPSEDYIPFEE